MLSWVTGIAVRRAIRQTNAGDVRALMRGYADDAVLVFPGSSSWGGTYRGKAEIEGLLRRVVDAGLQFAVTDVVARGAPWDLTVCFRMLDKLDGPDGTRVYANRVSEFLRVSWTKIRYQEVYLDTEKVAALDRHLAAEGRSA